MLILLFGCVPDGPVNRLFLLGALESLLVPHTFLTDSFLERRFWLCSGLHSIVVVVDYFQSWIS
jgi:hypothetical protein